MIFFFRRMSLVALAVSTLGVGYQAAAEPQNHEASSSNDTEITEVTVHGGVLHPSRHFPDRAAGYFTIHNAGAADLLLKGITSPLCTSVTSNHSNQEMIETTGDSDDIFQHLAIPHKSTMVFPAAGYHLSCRGLHRSLQNGESIPFTFHFLDVGHVSTNFTVQSTTGK
ncbi:MULTISPECIES: copper chaperone PCu(A)C [unclassified Saccharibacter]|uniref:copper chaperone PCu(A)C n=1 Tax=unclassified Saccharibacter TaxID=2648722 RepID=UPI001EF05D3E|nr:MULTISPECIES: copper chaperone PCu(A)C [unclassified Saccharibacter]